MTPQRWVRAVVLLFMLVWNGGIGLLMATDGPPLFRQAVAMTPPYLALGFAGCLVFYYGAGRWIRTNGGRRLLCAGILIVGFGAYTVAFAASGFNLRVMAVAGSLWGGALFAVAAVVPLWTSRRMSAGRGAQLPTPRSPAAPPPP